MKAQYNPLLKLAMKSLGMPLVVTASIATLVFSTTQRADAAGDIFDGYIEINGTWYNIGGVNDGRNNPSGSANAATRTLLSNVDFGTQTLGSFNITGFQINAWTSFGTSADNNGANYKVWRAGDAEPGYTNFWNTTSESYYSGGDYVSSTTGQSTGIIGDTFINGDTYNLKFQTYTVQTGDNAGTKFYERSDSFVVNGARQLITGSSNTTQSAAYNTSANGGIVKQGTGSLFLTKDNSNATTGQKGTIYIDEGTVAVNPDAGVSGNNALGGSSAVVQLGATGGTANANFALADSDGGLSISRSIVVRGGSSGTKTISSTNTSGTNTLSSLISLDNNVTLSSASGGTLELSGNLEDGLATGAFGVAIAGSGKVVFSGASNNTGITGYTVNNGATLSMNKSSADSVQSTLTIDSGGTAEFAASNQLGASATIVNNGTLATGSSGLTDSFGSLSSSGTISGNGTLTASTYALSGGTVSANLGAGSLTVGGSTALNGTSAATSVSVNSGTLSLGGNNRLATDASVTLGAGAALGLGANSQQLAGLTGDGSVTTSASGSLNLNIASGSNTYAGSISGGGGLTKSGNGTLFLTGSNSLTGTTAVSSGTLRVNGSIAGDASVAGGATLGGTGTIAGAVNVTGILSPGASIESLAVGTTTFGNGSTFEWEYNSQTVTADLLDINGSLNLDGSVTLTLIDLAESSTAISEGTKFTLISYSGSWNNVSFSGYADDSTFNFGGMDWIINYNDATGGNNYSGDQAGASGFVTMTVVPEPSSLGLALVAGGLLATRRRRKA